MTTDPVHISFVTCMQTPSCLQDLPLQQLEEVLRYARRANLLGSLAARARVAGVETGILADTFEGATLYAAEQRRFIEWEMQQFAQLAETLSTPVLVLKGGAYLGMGLASADGRLVSDLDLMVPQEQLGKVEQAMLDSGYLAQKQDDYDQHYYREWMHELPPMSHAARGTVVDLHHNIAPPVSRLKIDARKLFERAVPLRPGLPYLRLGDEDIVLHLCVHMFHDGELYNSLRELFDLDALLRRFVVQEGHVQRLLARAAELGLMRPLYFGTRFCHRLLATPLPDELLRGLARSAPRRPWRYLVEWAMARSILPVASGHQTAAGGLAQQLLFLRAHWLRMPPLMLVRHLWTQYRRRGGLKTAEQAALDGGGRG